MKTFRRCLLGAIAAVAAWVPVAWGDNPQMPEYSFTPGFIINTSNTFVVVNAGQPAVFQPAAPVAIAGGTLTPDYDPNCIALPRLGGGGISLSCPPDLTVNCSEGRGVTVNYDNVLITTNLCGPSIYSECLPPSGSTFQIGVTEVHCRVPAPGDPGWLPGYAALNLDALFPPCTFTVTVVCPVFVIQQPQSRTVHVGEPVSFTVLADGTPPLAYQWFHTNSAIPGATNADFTLASVQSGDAGAYTVVITNPDSPNGVTSDAAILTVEPSCLADCPVLFSGLTNSPIGSAIVEVVPDPQTGSSRLVVHNYIPADGIAVRTDAAQFVRLGFDCLDPGTLADGANLTFRAFGEVNHSNDQVVATFQAADVGNDIEYRARFDSLGDVPLLAVLYDGSNIVGTARLPSGPPFPPIARVTGQAGDARVTPFLPLDGYPATILEFPAARPLITLTGGQPVPGTRLVLTPDVPKLQPPDRPFELLNDVVNDGLNFWWQNPSNYIRNCTVEGPISRLEVLAAFVPEVRILDEQVGQFGMAHQALGDTQFLAGDNPTDLMVLPDAFDNGGIDILAGSDDAWNGNSGATPFNFRQRFLVEGGTNGAFVQTGIIGPMFNTNELVAGIKVTQMASNIFSLDGGQNWQTAEVWRDGALVATTAGSNGVVATATAWPDRAGVNSPFSNPLNGTNNILLTLGWNSNIPLNLTGGGSVTGDELRVGYNDQSFSQETHAFSLRFGGLQSLRLIDETVAPAGFYFQGFAHRPLGSASLDVMSNELVVTIPGTNSGHGVSIALGNAGFADVDFAGFAATDPDGAKIEMRASGTKLGVPGQSLGAICAIKDGSNTLFAVDRTPLGSDSSMLSVFDQARLVWVVSQMPTGMLRASDRFPLRWRINPVDPKSLGASPTIIDFPDRPLLVLPDGNAVRGDRVMISEFDPEHTNRTEVSSVARLDVTGMGLPSFRISGERLGAFHQAHQAVGQARLLGIGDWVRLGDLVSGGANPDGVEFPLIGKDTFTVFWRQLDRFGEVPAGAVLRASVNDSPTGPLRISQVTSLGGQKEISADFSSLGASSRYVEVLRSNVVVFSNSFNGEAGAVARTTAWPAGFKAGRGQNQSSNVYTSWAWVSPEDFMIAGQTISGDELRLRAIPTLPNNFAPSSIRVQVAGIPDLHLVYDAASAQAPIKTSIQALPGGILVIFWDTSNPGQVLQQADDPAALWQDIPGATASPYLIRPAGEKKFLRVFQK